MARPLRIDVEGGWYHVMARGAERRTLFVDDQYHQHFLELVEEMSARYEVGVHAFVLMGSPITYLFRRRGPMRAGPCSG